MKTTAELMNAAIASIMLKILVFGPQVKSPSSDVRTSNLQKKRIQIRNELELAGHFVKYAEDVVDPALPAPMNNVFIQEVVIMKEYDLIVTLVDSPGSHFEASAIALTPTLAQKSSLFLDEDYATGLSGEACRSAQTFGADFTTFKYPTDLVDCNLLGFVQKKVRAVQMAQYFS